MKIASTAPLDVTIIVPCRNERGHIEEFLRSLHRQDLQEISWEVLIADGMSDDGTRAIIESYCQEYPMRMVDNPQQIVSTGLNKAIAEARGRYILRMDVHTTYAPDYIRECLRIAKITGAENVGGPWVPRGEGYLGSAIAAVFQSRFGNGAAKAHDPNYEGPVDTVYLGCWPRHVFQRFGLFDPILVRNQDDELNLRLRRGGGEVWQSPKIVSVYRPRSSLQALFRQYMQYGYWKVAVIRKHRVAASLRHLVPGAFVAANSLLVLATLLSFLAGFDRFTLAMAWIWAALIGTYLILYSLASILAARRHGWELLPVLPVVFAVYHVSYGFGFLLGMFHCSKMTRRNDPAPAFTELTR